MFFHKISETERKEVWEKRKKGIDRKEQERGYFQSDSLDANENPNT